MASPTSNLADIVKILDHPRAVVSWILRPALDSNGAPVVVRVARIVTVRPVDGAGTLRVAVTDWGVQGTGNPAHYVGKAGGYGYDKRTAALAGATVAGIQLGDHCDHAGRPTLDRVVYDNGLTML